MKNKKKFKLEDPLEGVEELTINQLQELVNHAAKTMEKVCIVGRKFEALRLIFHKKAGFPEECGDEETWRDLKKYFDMDKAMRKVLAPKNIEEAEEDILELKREAHENASNILKNTDEWTNAVQQ